MKFFSSNLFILLVVAAIGGFVVWKKMQPQAREYESCYEDRSVAGQTQKVREKGYKDPVIMAAIGNADRIKAILKYALASTDADKVAVTLRRLHARPFKEVFSPQGAAYEDVREFLFLLADVQGVDPKSRGPFIDAREIAFIERIWGEPFLQINRYPDPAPMAATSMKEAFRRLHVYVYAELASHGAGKQLFDFSGAGGNVLSQPALQKISAQSAALDPDDRLKLWQNVIRTIPSDIGELLTTADRAALDKHIAASLPAMTFKTLKESLSFEQKDVYRDRAGRKIAFNIIFTQDMNNRTICYMFAD